MAADLDTLARSRPRIINSGDCEASGGLRMIAPHMQKLTAKDLAEHVTQLEQASIEELDELLTDLLVQVYPTKVTQDS
jgi:hypothetical protein